MTSFAKAAGIMRPKEEKIVTRKSFTKTTRWALDPYLANSSWRESVSSIYPYFFIGRSTMRLIRVRNLHKNGSRHTGPRAGAHQIV